MDDTILRNLFKVISDIKTLPRIEYLALSSQSLQSENNYLNEITVVPNAKFIEFMTNILNINLSDPLNKLINPAIIFSKLAVTSGLLRIPGNIGPETYGHGILILSKIYMDKFGVFAYDDEGKILNYKDFGFGRIDVNYSDIDNFIKGNSNYTHQVTRHPQLRRLLSKYCDINNIYFDSARLVENLKMLDINNTLYNYYDADEYIIKYKFEDTYFSIIPNDIKNVIISHVDYLISQVNIEENILSEVIGNLINNGFEPGRNNSIEYMFEKLSQTESFEKVRKGTKGERGMNEYIEKMGGMSNIIQSAITVAVNQLSEYNG